MFTPVRTWGSHTVYKQDHPFRTLLEQLQGVSDLETLQDESEDYRAFREGRISDLQDVESDLHKKFQTWIKTQPDFKDAQCQMIREIHREFFPQEPALIQQSFPSIRIQQVGNRAVPPHCDSDDVGRHPLGERNFLLPITRMIGTNRLFIESIPGANDTQGIDLNPGEILQFDGNKCIHSNQQNQESFARISFDFRVIPMSDYMRQIAKPIASTNPRNGDRVPVKILVGGQYQCVFREDSPEVMKQWFAQKTPILQTRPSFDHLEATACAEQFTKGDPFLTEYKETEKLEAQLASMIGVPSCFMVPSGTSAIVTALVALGVQSGDEVVVPNQTMVATGNAVRLIGATPVFVNVHPETQTVDLEGIQAAVTSKTRAVIHVSLNNRSRGLAEIAEWCRSQKIGLIEDAAQSLGCWLNGSHQGTQGDIGCFSLSSPKIITTGQGGFLVTRNPALADSIRKIKNFGRRESGGEVQDGFGVNFKFTDIQAVIGLAQLSKIDERRKRLRTLQDLYSEKLSGCQKLRVLPAQDADWIPWFVDIEVSDRESLASFLKQHGVQTRITQPSLCSEKVSPISEKGLFLPTHMLVTDSELSQICHLIRLWDASESAKEVGLKEFA